MRSLWIPANRRMGFHAFDCFCQPCAPFQRSTYQPLATEFRSLLFRLIPNHWNIRGHWWGMYFPSFFCSLIFFIESGDEFFLAKIARGLFYPGEFYLGWCISRPPLLFHSGPGQAFNTLGVITGQRCFPPVHATLSPTVFLPICTVSKKFNHCCNIYLKMGGLHWMSNREQVACVSMVVANNVTLFATTIHISLASQHPLQPIYFYFSNWYSVCDFAVFFVEINMPITLHHYSERGKY